MSPEKVRHIFHYPPPKDLRRDDKSITPLLRRDGNGSNTIPRDGIGSNNNVNANKLVKKYWVLPPSSLGPPSGVGG